MSTPTLALCMIVKNEEKCLQSCLDSVQGLVDEVVIVDTGSTDGTLEIARQFNVNVFQEDWPGDFSTARNMSISRATSDWILILDADEALDPQAHNQLEGILADTQAAGLRLCVRSLLAPEDLVRYHDLQSTRVFQNHPQIRYEGMIHESVVDSIARMGGWIQDTDLVIFHSGYSRSDVQGGSSRGDRNLDLLLKMLAAAPQDAYLHYQLGITYKRLGRPQEAIHHLKQVLSLDIRQLTPAIMGDALMKLAQLESAENREKDCILHARASLKYTPNNILSMYLVALAYMGLGQVDQAYPYFVQIRQSPIELLNDIENLDEVIAYCRQVLGIRD